VLSSLRQQQEHSCRKQIARKLRRQYVDGMYRPKYYTVTLKSRLRITQGHWKRNHWQIIHDSLLVELFDDEYYRDREIWVRGHSRSLNVVQFESLGAVSYSPSIVTMALSRIVFKIYTVFQKKFTLLLFAITKSDVDRFQYYLVGM